MKKIAGSTHPITHAPHSPRGRYGMHPVPPPQHTPHCKNNYKFLTPIIKNISNSKKNIIFACSIVQINNGQ